MSVGAKETKLRINLRYQRFPRTARGIVGFAMLLFIVAVALMLGCDGLINFFGGGSSKHNRAAST